MSSQTERPPKIGTEITVRISLAFQEVPDVHTLLAMTPVRERGKLVRLALERYIAETGHPAGDVEQQIHAISTWLRSRAGRGEKIKQVTSWAAGDRTAEAAITHLVRNVSVPMPMQNDSSDKESTGASPSIKRWLQT